MGILGEANYLWWGHKAKFMNLTVRDQIWYRAAEYLYSKRLSFVQLNGQTL